MKSSTTAIIVMLLIVFGVLGAFYLIFGGANLFVSSFDGDSRKSNFKLMTSSYYLNSGEYALYYRDSVNNKWDDLKIRNVDSLSWGNDLIAGHCSGRYFLIKTHSGEIVYYKMDERVKFVKDIGAPANAYRNIPSIKY